MFITALSVGVAQHATNNTAAWIALAGVIVVALIAAVTAQWRLHVQLDREDKRLSMQLSHDRAQSELADLRTVLEEALSAAARANFSVGQAWVRGEVSPDSTDALSCAQMQLDRLQIRLGRDHPIVNEYVQMTDSMFALQRRPRPSSPTGDIPATAMNTPELRAWGQAYHQYVALARDRVGVGAPFGPDVRAAPDRAYSEGPAEMISSVDQLRREIGQDAELAIEAESLSNYLSKASLDELQAAADRNDVAGMARALNVSEDRVEEIAQFMIKRAEQYKRHPGFKGFES
jgi:hypothetical protein